jgi:hypothetical protein
MDDGGGGGGSVTVTALAAAAVARGSGPFWASSCTSCTSVVVVVVVVALAGAFAASELSSARGEPMSGAEASELSLPAGAALVCRARVTCSLSILVTRSTRIQSLGAERERRGEFEAV